jgi:hypothetical protein
MNAFRMVWQKQRNPGMRIAKSELKKTFENKEAVIHEGTWNDVHVEYDLFKENFEAASLSKQMLGNRNRNPSPRWGIVVKGQVRLKDNGNEELAKAGDAYCLLPEHIVFTEAGTEIWEFSPAGKLKKSLEIIKGKANAVNKKEVEQSLVTTIFFPNCVIATAEPNKL